jgi:hypothetical protein
MHAKTNGRVQRSAAEWQILSRFSESGGAGRRLPGRGDRAGDDRPLGAEARAKKAAKKAAWEFVEVRPVSVAGLGGWQGIPACWKLADFVVC